MSWRRRKAAVAAAAAATAAAAMATRSGIQNVFVHLTLRRHGSVSFAATRVAPPLGPRQVISRSASAASRPTGVGSGMEDMESWPAKKLRSFLDERGIAHNDCFEKRELIDRARTALATQPSPSAAATSAKFSAARAAFRNFGELLVIKADGSVDSTSSSTSEASSIVFLHGLGDTAQGWAGLLPGMLSLPGMRYVLPTAEALPFAATSVTSWFDAGVLSSMTDAGAMNNLMSTVGPQVMQNSINYCHHLLRVELERGIASERLFLGGFSQGGCVAVRAALSFPDAALGGCVAASTFLGSASDLPVADANQRLPILCCHGEADEVVPLAAGQGLADMMRNRGVPAEWRTYPGMGHTSCQEQAVDIRRFVQRRLVVAEGDSGLNKRRARDLKILLQEMGVDTSGCYEKADLLERARAALLK